MPCTLTETIDGNKTFIGVCKLVVAKGNNGAMIKYNFILDNEDTKFIYSLFDGNSVEYKIKFENMENTALLRFSLIGFTSAFKRAVDKTVEMIE